MAASWRVYRKSALLFRQRLRPGFKNRISVFIMPSARWWKIPYNSVNTHFKIVRLGQLQKKIAQLRRQKKVIAFTNGCFDILHDGHVSYLEKAKKSGRILIVAVNSDASVRAIKGAKRPIVSQKERAHVLAALACVDFVTIFNEPTPIKVIETLKPTIAFKDRVIQTGEVIVGTPVVAGD